MAEITIVTALFDIGREKWTGFERNKSEYIEYFKFWARMRNKVVVYTDQETAEQVRVVRDSFGLTDRTTIIVIDDITVFDSEVYHRMKQVLSNEITIKFRRKPKCPECYNALYDYIMYLKPYFVADAIKKGFADGMIAWMDFGYNHGGKFYTNPLEFDYLWKFDFSPKIHLFSVAALDDMPIFEIVRTMKTYVAGGIVVAPANLWEVLADLFRKHACSLASCGMMDDDQTLLIMAYRERPELFEIHPIEDFFCPLKDFGGSHLTVYWRQSKRTRLSARKSWQEGQYRQALQGYLRYAVEKLRKI